MKKYEMPELKVENFVAEDIVTTSANNEDQLPAG